ncbi:MAG TPA: hypothetical protein VN911_06040 [Candidatus Acidoferrum sp.]|nr:hypothetical protein [Candidatus Acidoferrum sp.]
MLQSTAAIVDEPLVDLPKILQAMKDGKDIVDAVMRYDKYPVVTSDLVTGVDTQDGKVIGHWDADNNFHPKKS